MAASISRSDVPPEPRPDLPGEEAQAPAQSDGRQSAHSHSHSGSQPHGRRFVAASPAAAATAAAQAAAAETAEVMHEPDWDAGQEQPMEIAEASEQVCLAYCM